MKQKLLFIFALLCMVAGTAWAESTWKVTNPTGSKFRITRPDSHVGTTETVKYRTVNLSAYAGQHYTAKSGEVTFGVNDTYKEITVTETTPGTDAYKYQDGAKRKYRFEVTDLGGFYLHHCDREITTGTSFSGSYVNKSVTDLVYFQSGSVKSGSGNKYLDVAHSGTNGTEKMIDDGYDYNDNTLCTVSTDNLYGSNSDLRTWLNSLSYKMYATVYFQQREVDDGYQYIQILADNASTYDGKDGDGKIDNGPTTSLYKAAFILTKNENVCTSWKYQAFPHKTDDHTSSTEFDYSDSYLYGQAFKSSSYRATTSGSLVLAPTVNDINVRFDANGSGDDTWYLKNLKVRLALVDASAPTVLSNSITVAPGRHSKGNTVYVSVAFNEIVTVTGTPTLTTTSANNWGSLSYVAGSGTNVLTFSGTIGNSATGNLNITGLSGTVKDLAGNSLTGSSVTATSLCSLDASYAYTITYELNGGTATNPASYTYETATFTLNNPTKTGYTFNGWTGSNGNTASTAVQIAKYSHGNKSYTANWTANTYTVQFNNNGGSGTMDDQSFTYDAAQNLSANTFTREDYVFYGWNTQADGNGTSYTDQQATSNVTAEDGATVTLYAQWRQVGGSCGTNARWNYDDNGTLSITGSGAMTGYNTDAPWVDYKPYITTVSIGSEITTINSQPFADCSNLTTINGGDGLTFVNSSAFNETPWLTAAKSSASVVYLGKVAFCGTGVSGDVTIQDETVNIAGEAFRGNSTITSVTLPASVSRIGDNAFRDCTDLKTVNVLGTTPPTLHSSAFLLSGENETLARTFNVRSVAYKTTGQWADIYNKENYYSGYTGTTLRVVSTLTLPASVTASVAEGNKVTILGTDYYTEQATVTLSPVYGLNITGATYNDGSDHNATDNGNGTWSFTMPAADATVSVSNNDLWGVESGCDGSTAEKAYTITTTDGLDLLATLVNNGEFNIFNGKYFRLGADITYSHKADNEEGADTENNYTAIGGYINDVDKYFHGIFDGQGHTVSGIRIYKGGDTDADCYQGLFGKALGATIKNVILTDARITGKQCVGGIAGLIMEDVGGGIVENCRVGSDVTIHAVAEYAYAHGGMVGQCNSGIIRGCVSSATLTMADDLIEIAAYGGIVGYLNGNMSDCLAIGASVPAITDNGAIAGYVYNEGGYTQTNNYHRDCTVGGNAAPSDTYNVSAYTISAGTDVTLASAGDAAQTYEHNGIKRYGDALYYGGVLYAPEAANVSLTLGYTGSLPTGLTLGYAASAGTLSGTDNPYTLTMPAEDVTVNATRSVKYIDADGTEKTCTDYTLLKSSTGSTVTLGTDGEEHWFAVSGNVNITNTNSYALKFYGVARLILCDGATLTHSGSHPLSVDGNLVIYGQSQGTGSLTAEGSGTAISVEEANTAVADNGTLTINGGSITARSTGGTNGISVYNSITINGGTVNATGGGFAGNGILSNHGDVTINGGTVSATSGSRGTGIKATNGNITLGWTNAADSITANSYYASGTISVKAGQAFSNGSETLYGTITDMSKLNGKTLQPVIPYIDANGDEQYCTDFTFIESSNSDVSFGTYGQTFWYVVSGEVSINGKLELLGHTHLILCDGATLTINSGDQKGIVFYNGDSYNLYSQKSGTGSIVVNSNSSIGIEASEDLNIYGGNINVTTGWYGIHSSMDINIFGGNINAENTSNYDGIYAAGNITLGWTNPTDRITASSYSARGTVSVKAGQALTDGTAAYNGTLTSTQVSDIAGLTLQPAYSIKLPDGITASDVLEQDGTTAYALPEATVTLSSEAGFHLADVTVTGTTATDKGNGTWSFTMPAVNVTVTATLIPGGYCGNTSVNSGQNVIWTYTPSTTTLTISPNPEAVAGGETNFNMAGYGDSDQPWNDYKDALTTVVVDAGVTSIGASAFYECSKLESITIPASVTTIDFYAFGECDNLETVTFAAGSLLTFIGNEAFYACEELSAITIPEHVTTIGDDAFAECPSLSTIIALPTTPPSMDTPMGIPTFQSRKNKNIYFRNQSYWNVEGWYECVAGNNYNSYYDFFDHGYLLVDNEANDIAALYTALHDDNRYVALHNDDPDDDNLPYEDAPTDSIVNVMLYGRTLYKDGGWNTLCLPFDVKVGSGPLEDATAMVLDGSTSNFETSTGVLTLNFTGVTSGNTIPAGTPFLVKWESGEDLVNPDFRHVSFSNSTNDVTSIDGRVQFKGTYSPVTLNSGDKSVLYLGTENKLYYPASNKNIGSCRAYFKLTDPSATVKQFVLNFGEGDDADGIDSLTPDPSPKGEGSDYWYDLNGRKLSDKPTQRGIYIHEGRKVVIP